MISNSELLHKLALAQVGSCSCQTKTPEARWHHTTCLYRVLAEAMAVVTTVDMAPQDPLPPGKLISIAAELACRRPLRPLEDLCERQKSISTAKLLESVEMCGDTLAQIALEIRQAYDEMRATITQQATEINRLQKGAD